MALINVIPAVSTYAVAYSRRVGQACRGARVRRQRRPASRRRSRPFAGFEGNVSVAMGDVDGDGVLDLIVGSRRGSRAGGRGLCRQVSGEGRLRDGTRTFPAFPAEASGGVSVAATQIDGTTADNIIVGSVARRPERGEGLSDSRSLASSGTAPVLFSSFNPYPGDNLGREPRHRLRRFLHRAQQHRHGTRRRQPCRGQGIRLSPDASGREQVQGDAQGQHGQRARRTSP